MKLVEILICLNCGGNLHKNEKDYTCYNCNFTNQIISDIPVIIPANSSVKKNEESLIEYFDAKYKSDDDPWDYESSAAEIMKYNFVVNLIKKTNPDIEFIIDVGCSFGYLSNKLSVICKNVIGLDASLHALIQAKSKYKNQNINFISASAENLPLMDEGFDAVIFCDGLNGMDLTGAHRDNAIKESLRVLKDKGFAIFTDYLNNNQFEDYINYIKKTDYTVKEIYYLNDRIWYKLKYSLHFFRKNKFFKEILSSLFIGKILGNESSMFGKSGSKHICILAFKN